METPEFCLVFRYSKDDLLGWEVAVSKVTVEGLPTLCYCFRAVFNVYN